MVLYYFSPRKLLASRNVFAIFTNRNVFSICAKTLTVHSMSHAWSTKKVIPELLPDVPPYKLAVQYPEITINEGTIIKPIQTKSPPAVSWTAKDKSALFALSMIDLDAPSKSKHVLRAWNHWLVVNIAGNDVDKGETIVEYIGAGPPKGTDLHRYVFLLFVYTQKISCTEGKVSNKSAEGRANFNIIEFTKKYKLGDPLAGNFFLAEYDEYVPELHKQIGLKH